MRLTLRQLAYFECLAETGHFGRAAQEAGVTQPALSAQIAEMEAQLGIQLFERGRGAVRLTPEGAELRPRIQRILSEVEDLERAAMRGRDILEGRFRLGVIPTVAPYLLPYLLPLLKESFPRLQLELRESITDTLLAEVGNGHLDAVVAAEPLNASGIEHVPLFEDRFLLAVPTSEVSRIAPPVAHEAMALERLMLLEEGHCLRAQALALCSKVEPVAMQSFGATSLATLLQMVSHGLGVTLIPEIAREMAERLPGVSALPFTEPVPSRIICLGWRTTNPRSDDLRSLSDCIKMAHRKAVGMETGAAQAAM